MLRVAHTLLPVVVVVVVTLLAEARRGAAVCVLQDVPCPAPPPKPTGCQASWCCRRRYQHPPAATTTPAMHSHATLHVMLVAMPMVVLLMAMVVGVTRLEVPLVAQRQRPDLEATAMHNVTLAAPRQVVATMMISLAFSVMPAGLHRVVIHQLMVAAAARMQAKAVVALTCSGMCVCVLLQWSSFGMGDMTHYILCFVSCCLCDVAAPWSQ